MKRFLNTALAITMMMTVGSVASADEYHRINSHAARIHAKTKQLLRETRHYEHTDAYYLMVNDCRQMAECTAVIREIARAEGSIFRLETELRKLDRAFCHIQKLFDQTEINAAHGHGCVKGNTKHVKRLLNAIQDCIDHMQEDVRAIRRRTQARTCPSQVRPPVYRPQLPPAPAFQPIRPVYGGYEYGTGNYGRYGNSNPWGAGRHPDYGYGTRGGISINYGRGSGFSFDF